MEAGNLPAIIHWSLEEIRFYFCKFVAGGNDALSQAREKSISGIHAGETVVWQDLFWKAAPGFQGPISIRAAMEKV